MLFEPNLHKVLLGMSGGIDSSVAIQVLKDTGFSVIGLMLLNGCVPISSVIRAEAAANRLNIELIIKDYTHSFDEAVVNPFIEGCKKGLTPNPCVLCNPVFKFGSLAFEADRLGIESIATGHYAKIVRKGEGSFIACSGAKANDQSYFLYRLPSEIRRRLIFPLGDLDKFEASRLAAELGLDYSGVKSSQEACFIDGDIRSWLRDRSPGLFKEGPAFDAEKGNLLGKHSGSTGFTIGQRKGHGVATGERAYIVQIDHASNSIFLGNRSKCLVDEISAQDIVLGTAAISQLSSGMRLMIKTRSSMKPVSAKVRFIGDKLYAKLETRSWASAPGQSLVCYDGEMIACGGIIC